MDTKKSKRIGQIILMFIFVLLPVIIYEVIGIAVYFAAIVIVVLRESSGKTFFDDEEYLSFVNRVISEKIYDNSMAIQLVSMLISIVVMVILWYILGRGLKKKGLYEKRRMTGNSLLYLLVVPTGIFTMCFGNCLVGFMECFMSNSMIEGYNSANESLHAGTMLVVVISTVILAPVLEEIIYRGIIFGQVKAYLGSYWAIFISALIFGVAHFNWVQGIYAFVIGLIFAFVREKYGTIFVSMVMHALANGIAIYAYYGIDGMDSEQNVTIEAYEYIVPIIIYGLLTLGFLILINKYVKTETVKTVNINKDSNLQL